MKNKSILFRNYTCKRFHLIVFSQGFINKSRTVLFIEEVDESFVACDKSIGVFHELTHYIDSHIFHRYLTINNNKLFISFPKTSQFENSSRVCHYLKLFVLKLSLRLIKINIIKMNCNIHIVYGIPYTSLRYTSR